MIRRLIRPVIRFAYWCFERPAPGLDLALAVLSAGWAVTAACAPDMFDRPSYAALGRMPPTVIVVVMSALCVAHAMTAWRPSRWWRLGPLFGSAFVWLSIAGGFAAVGTWTDVVVYALAGGGCLFGAIYIETEREA